MPFSQLKDRRKRTVGAKETKKKLDEGQLIMVFIAMDAERRIIRPIIEIAAVQGVPVEEVSTMKELGRACGVDVKAAVCGLLKE